MHFSDELCVVIVILYLQVGRSFFVNTLQHLNRIGREHMGVFRQPRLFEFRVGVDQLAAAVAAIPSADIIFS